MDNMKTDLLTSTKIVNTKEKKFQENVGTLKKQTTMLEKACNDQTDNITSIYHLKNK